MQPIAQSDISAGSSDVLMKKLGNNRSQNLRASTLLLKSQEMRAKNDEMEREKSTRERKVLLERKEKSIKENQTYMQSLRDSILTKDELIRLTPSAVSYPKTEILEKCTTLKSEGISSQLDDAQLQSLSQVIVSTILYVWKESNSMVNNRYSRLPDHLKTNLKFCHAGCRLPSYDREFYKKTCFYKSLRFEREQSFRI